MPLIQHSKEFLQRKKAKNEAKRKTLIADSLIKEITAREALPKIETKNENAFSVEQNILIIALIKAARLHNEIAQELIDMFDINVFRETELMLLIAQRNIHQYKFPAPPTKKQTQDEKADEARELRELDNRVQDFLIKFMGNEFLGQATKDD